MNVPASNSVLTMCLLFLLCFSSASKEDFPSQLNIYNRKCKKIANTLPDNPTQSSHPATTFTYPKPYSFPSPLFPMA